MILGTFRDHLARASLTLSGIGGPVEIEFVVDTGFEGEMALPRFLLARLDARPLFHTRRRLADGSIRECPAYEVSTDWNGDEINVQALILEGRPLIGTYLLDGCSLSIDLHDGGDVTIEFPA